MHGLAAAMKIFQLQRTEISCCRKILGLSHQHQLEGTLFVVVCSKIMAYAACSAKTAKVADILALEMRP